jgi:hypothetical protein
MNFTPSGVQVRVGIMQFQCNLMGKSGGSADGTENLFNLRWTYLTCDA